ncbi:hypothetical protein [Candidatus Hepatobacter penaei]|uniref:hypothetical protein n=1 Tax=Candidatus Hepatobacter penaei TaxID=1274402 RepID=UPI0004F3AD24|nr:hypothetical protein [Candidatus Hepatobacter penaei]
MKRHFLSSPFVKYTALSLVVLGTLVAVWVGSQSLLRPSPHFDITIARHDFGKKESSDTLVRLSSFKKPKIVILWTLGCVPCLKFLMICNKMAMDFKEKGIDIIPILISHNVSSPQVLWGHAVVYLARLIQKNTYTQPTWQVLFPHLTPYYDMEGNVFSALKVTGTPTILFLDKKNRILEKREGFQNWQVPSEKEALYTLLDRMKQ